MKKKNRNVLRFMAASVLFSLMMLWTVPFAPGSRAVSAEEAWTEVSSESELTAALANGGNIRMTASIETGSTQITKTAPSPLSWKGAPTAKT